VALVVGAAKFGSSDSPKVQGINTTGPKLPKRHHKPTRPMARLVLTATNGDSWLLVRAGPRAGKQLYAGTLPPGHQLPFTRGTLLSRRLRFASNKPQHLMAKLNGRLVFI